MGEKVGSKELRQKGSEERAPGQYTPHRMAGRLYRTEISSTLSLSSNSDWNEIQNVPHVLRFMFTQYRQDGIFRFYIPSSALSLSVFVLVIVPIAVLSCRISVKRVRNVVLSG